MENIEIEILKKIDENNNKIDAIYVSVEKTRKYFLWSVAITVLMFVLPLLGVILIIPWLLSTIDYASMGL